MIAYIPTIHLRRKKKMLTTGHHTAYSDEQEVRYG